MQEVCITSGNQQVSVGFKEVPVLGPSEWWFEFWREYRIRDQERAATLSRPEGTQLEIFK